MGPPLPPPPHPPTPTRPVEDFGHGPLCWTNRPYWGPLGLANKPVGISHEQKKQCAAARMAVSGVGLRPRTRICVRAIYELRTCASIHCLSNVDEFVNAQTQLCTTVLLATINACSGPRLMCVCANAPSMVMQVTLTPFSDNCLHRFSNTHSMRKTRCVHNQHAHNQHLNGQS